MINISNVYKSFGDIRALEDISININDATIYGLIGSNGAGKSTLLKILCGAYNADRGTVRINETNVFNNPDIKKDIVFISDEQYFLNNNSIKEMADFYKAVYRNFNDQYYSNLLEILQLDPNRKINTFSKGMQKQTSILLGLSCRPKFLFCDETFDGLDPVMRLYIKKLLASDTADYMTTTIIASHNLRELEDICDHVGVLHKGGIMFERDLDDLKLEIHNFQVSFKGGAMYAKEDFPQLKILKMKNTGSVMKMTIKGNKEDIMRTINEKSPILAEFLPLTLEEIFIEEMEAKGYDFNCIG